MLRFDINELFDKEIHVRRKRTTIGYPIHWHEYYEIMLYSDCQGLCVMNGEDYAISDKCLFFLTPTDYHSIKVDKKDGAYSINVSFSDNIIDNYIIENERICPRLIQTPSAYTLEIVLKMYDVFTNKPDSTMRNIELRHLLNCLLIEIFNYGTPLKNNTPITTLAVRNAVIYMLSDISKPYTLTEISEICGFTPTYFSSLFHQETGKSFKKWLIDTRIEHAKRMLETGDSSILDICYACGYSSFSYFIQLFRESTGVTPHKYRSQNQK